MHIPIRSWGGEKVKQFRLPHRIGDLPDYLLRWREKHEKNGFREPTEVQEDQPDTGFEI
jgi:hypothetical protein